MTRARSLSQLANENVFTADASNSRVGIGSTTPDAKLDVAGNIFADDLTVRNITGVAATFSGVVTYEDVTNVDSVGIITARSDISIADKIIHTGDTNTAIRFPAADTFTVETAGSEALRITSDGKIGIGGETSPEFKVTIYDAEYSGVTIKSNRTTATDNLGGLHFKTQSTNVAYIQSLVDGTIKFRNTSSLTERLRIDSSGNVGINTTTPTEKLSVNGNVVFGHDQPAGNPGSTIGVATVRGHHVNSDADYAELYFANSTSSGGSTASIRAGRSGDNAGTNLTFYTQQFGGSGGNGTERLRIDQNGNVKIGSGAPAQSLHVTDSTAYEGILINGNGAPRVTFARSSNTTVEWGVGIDGTDGSKFAIAQAGNTAKLIMDVGGNVNITGVGTAIQWDATSDITLKENIEIINEPIVKLSQLKGVTFDWKFGGHSVGVIAQDVEKVLPTAVGGSKDQKTVNYNAIIGLLVESVKDQQKQIEELKSLLDK
jgi:hypothetical protein